MPRSVSLPSIGKPREVSTSPTSGHGASLMNLKLMKQASKEQAAVHQIGEPPDQHAKRLLP